MRRQVKTLAGQTLTTLDCSPSDSIETIKNQIKDRLGLHPTYDAIVICQGMQYQTTHKPKKYTFFLVLHIRKGYFDFIKREFSSSAPSYRTVAPGINLVANCMTPGCRAYQQSVWVQKGFGNFNIVKQIFFCECPECHKTTGQAYNMGYYKTKIRIQGKKDSGKQIFELKETVTENELTTFLHSDEEMRKWNFLQVRAKPL